MEDKAIYVHEVKLKGDSEFTEKFNHISDLYAAYEAATTEEEKKEKWQLFYQAKMALEMGY